MNRRLSRHRVDRGRQCANEGKTGGNPTGGSDSPLAASTSRRPGRRRHRSVSGNSTEHGLANFDSEQFHADEIDIWVNGNY
jgi:hypothetical protein